MQKNKKKCDWTWRSVYRNDRDKSRGGGVLIAVRKTLISSEIFKSNDTELIAVKIHHNHRPTVLAAYYRPPTKHGEKYLETVYKEFTHLKQLTKNGNIWIAGDFNLPDIDWKSMSVATKIFWITWNQDLSLRYPPSKPLIFQLYIPPYRMTN